MSVQTLLQKLQIKKGRRVCFLNPPPDYSFKLGKIPLEVRITKPKGRPADIIQLFVKNSKELEEALPELVKRLNPGGILWITYHKSTSDIKTDLNRDRIRRYANTLGWRTVGMISVDQDWSALRLKWPGDRD
jgi:hypothetical protein